MDRILTNSERTALEQINEFLVEQEGKSHGAYFGSGWAGVQLRALLKRDFDCMTESEKRFFRKEP